MEGLGRPAGKSIRRPGGRDILRSARNLHPNVIFIYFIFTPSPEVGAVTKSLHVAKRTRCERAGDVFEPGWRVHGGLRSGGIS